LADTQRTKTPSRVVVIGLGRFGSSLARELARRGYEILGIDSDPRRVQVLADDLTHTVVADTTDEESLRQLGVPDFERAVVGIGSNLEASILTTSLLVDFGVPNIWAKALNHQQGRILERIGAHHVVLPEHDMGERVAHLVTGRMLDFIQFEDDYALIKTIAPAEAVGRALGESRLRSKYGVTVVGIKRPGEGFTYATAETAVHQGDVLIVAGKTAAVERVADLD
jgi:trk system potassium uptake protein TrkA